MMDYRATCGYLPHFSQFTQAPLIAPTHGNSHKRALNLYKSAQFPSLEMGCWVDYVHGLHGSVKPLLTELVF
jgi:hypothetical protein